MSGTGGGDGNGSDGAARDRAHVVVKGESLWRIAEAHLGEGASDAKIAATVNELWNLNADKIGTGDPDLILPGQHLKMPA